jgi:hypothetical protein
MLSHGPNASTVVAREKPTEKHFIRDGTSRMGAVPETLWFV